MIVFAGGGTGGHLTPGLAVAEALRLRDPEIPLLFVGTDRPVESQLLAGQFDHHALTIEPGLRVWRNPIRFAWSHARAFTQSLALLRKTQPAAVVGLGGLASAPVVMAARRLQIPRVLLEQNVVPGRANRWLSRFADRVCLSFAESAAFFPRARCLVTGNPVRRTMTQLAQEQPPPGDPPVLLILGGSQGARPINAAMIQAADSRLLQGYRVIHQTGTADLELVRAAYDRAGVTHTTAAFFTAMDQCYRDADLVVSRAGATTLAELACAGKPSILIPYPEATDDHQRFNALVFQSAGAAQMVLQGDSSQELAQLVCQSIQQFLENPDRVAAARKALAGLRRPEAAEAVVSEMDRIIREKGP